MKKIKSFFRFFYNGAASDATPLTKEQYEDELVNIDLGKAKNAFDRACAVRDFEIEMYWKRANYFWAFIASTFAGYFLLISSEKYIKADQLFNHVEVYFLICIGLVLSIAWIFTNIGSKSWQRHWEVHVDLLEDQFTGPLYKTVRFTRTYSVSKINEIVSGVFAVIWFLLGIKYLIEEKLLNYGGKLNWLVLLSSLTVLLAVMAMVFGHGRGRFRERDSQMYRRKITY